MISLIISIGFIAHGVKLISATAAGTSVIVVGTGDISSCGNTTDSKTAVQLGDMTPSYVFALGDNVYQSGTMSEFQNCYHPTWGVWKSRTKPVPGNHEYQTSGASGYYNYFGVPRY